MILSEFLPPWETVRAEDYCDVLRHLKEAVWRKRPDLWARDESGYREFRLQHDNAPPHTSVLTLALIRESDILIVPHPPYSPDLAPSDYFLFPRLKAELRGHRFRTLDDMKTVCFTTTSIYSISLSQAKQNTGHMVLLIHSLKITHSDTYSHNYWEQAQDERHRIIFHQNFQLIVKLFRSEGTHCSLLLLCECPSTGPNPARSCTDWTYAVVSLSAY